MKISDFAIQNPVKVTVGVFFVAIFGLIALFRIPVQLTPEVARPVISVRTDWPGAGPPEIEKEIVSKQEEQLQDVEGMIDFRSTCWHSRCEVEMEFKVGTDINATLLQVANKLDQVEEYPEDAEEPLIRTVSSTSSSIAYFSLMPLPPSHDQLRAFREAHPELADVVDPLIAAETVDVVEVYALADKYPAFRGLIANDPQVLDMRTFAQDNIARRLARVPGVAESDVYGGSELELRVVVDPARLAAHKITITQLRQALTAESADVSGGDLWEGKRRYMVRTLGEFIRPEQVEEVIVATRDGAPVYVEDVAAVELTGAKTTGIGRQRGVSMITVYVKRREGANILDVMAGVKAAVAELNAELLKAHRLQLFQSYDETVYITASTRLVRNNVFIGGSLAVLVLLLFLRNGRSTLVVALAIPISIVGSFLIVRLAGRSINVISLAGMSFAVGMVVDNAIVVLENIFSHYQKGEQPYTAASRGTSEVWGAILASTLTTLAVFLPVIFIEEEAGQLFRDIAIAISAGVSISLLVSLTVIPSAASRLLRRHTVQPELTPKSRGMLDAAGGGFIESVVSLTRRLQSGRLWLIERIGLVVVFAFGVVCLVPVTFSPQATWPYHWPRFDAWWLVAAAAATLAITLLVRRAPRFAVVVTMITFSLGASYKLMPPAEYLPVGNKNLIIAVLNPPPGYNIDRLSELGKRVEARLQPYWEAEPGSEEAAQLDGPLIESFFLVVRSTVVFMGARARDADRAAELIPVLQRATSDLPGVGSFVSQSSLFERGRSGGRRIAIEISGPELTKLLQLGRHVMEEVQRIYPPETETGVQSMPSLDLGSPELHIRRNLEKAAERGINTAELGYTINALVDGAYAGTFWHEGKEIDLTIYGADEHSLRTQDVAQLPIGTPSGELVRIADVADVDISTGLESIERIDRQRAVTIQVRPGPDIALEDAMQAIDSEILAPLRGRSDFSGLYQIQMAGTADQLRQMQSALTGSMILAVVITFLLIAALYESFIYPVVIMISVPLAAVGGFAGLQLQNLLGTQRLDTLSMLGFIILIGTVVNNAILIVNQALHYIRRDGMEHRAAVEHSVRGRIRPIFMSTSTTLLGMLPLCLFTGSGSELYRGLGSVVLGGLLVSSVFTLFLVPMLFTLLYELKSSIVQRFSQTAAERAIEVPAASH